MSWRCEARFLCNQPSKNEGKANTAGTWAGAAQAKTKQTNKPKRYPPNPLLFDPSREAQLNNNSPYQH
jgi:hypothetical protein